MPFNIPMPEPFEQTLMKGVNTGSGMFSRLMQPVLEREKQAQLERHFQEQLKLSKAAAARAAQKDSPMYAINQYMALQNWLKKGQQGGVPSQTGGQQDSAMPMPQQEAGEGMGMFSPQGLEAAQQMPQQSQIPSMSAPQAMNTGVPQASSVLDLDLMRQNPMLRGWAKKHLGFDPLAQVPQTPQEKQAMALDLYEKKEALKAGNKGGDIPTPAVLTQNQQALQGIDTVLPMLDELINEPSKVYGKYDFSPSKKAAYNAKTSGMIDTLVAAQSLPKVQASIDLVEQQIRRATNEGDEPYIKRLKDLKADLVLRRGKAQSVLQNKKINTEALPPETKTLAGKKYEKINGEWHEIH